MAYFPANFTERMVHQLYVTQMAVTLVGNYHLLMNFLKGILIVILALRILLLQDNPYSVCFKLQQVPATPLQGNAKLVRL